MTAVAATEPLAAARTRPARALALLSWREARRILTRPVYMFIVAGILIGG